MILCFLMTYAIFYIEIGAKMMHQLPDPSLFPLHVRFFFTFYGGNSSASCTFLRDKLCTVDPLVKDHSGCESESHEEKCGLKKRVVFGRT